MPGQRYTDRERGEALALLDANEGNVAKTARMLGLPESTLTGWQDGVNSNPDVVLARVDKRKPLADVVEDMAHLVLGYLPASLPKASSQQLAITFGILTEKMLLLRGQPTSITESLMSDEARAERVAILMEQARQRQLTGSEVSTIAGNLSPADKSTDDDDSSNPPAAAQPTMTR